MTVRRIEPTDVDILLYAKYPEPGRVKTRLISALGPDGAAELYRAFLLDMIESLLSTFPDALRIGVADSEDVPRMAALIQEVQFPRPLSVPIEAQFGEDLGARMATSFATHFSRRSSPLMIVGSDHPTLPATYIQAGRSMLTTKDVVLGPAEDGGFYTIGLSRDVVHIFDELPWSTPDLYDVIIKRLSDTNLSIGLLPEWYDVDTPRDLARLSREVTGIPSYQRIDGVLRRLKENQDE